MKKLRFAVIGCGFWANYQIAAWQELEGVTLIAVCDEEEDKARSLAGRFTVPHYYQSAETLFQKEPLDFVDIITPVETHAALVSLAASYGVAVICQKPMAPDYETARQMVAQCKAAGVPFFVHENFRWQTPLRRLKALLEAGAIGQAFKARIVFCSSFPVFDNQPFLARLEQFILTDVGSHILDVARFLFGEAATLFCLTQTVNPKIRGEDVANVLMQMRGGLHCYAEMSYASVLENERFPQTFVLVESEQGSVYLGPDFEISITTREGTRVLSAPPPTYTWADPNYAVVHASIVEANRNILHALQSPTNTPAETTGEDNLKTVQLVFAAYASARQGEAVSIMKNG